MHIVSEVFYTYVVMMGLIFGFFGLVGGLFLGEGVRGAFASAFAFLVGAVAAGLVVWLTTFFTLRLAPAAGVLFLPLAAFIGGYLLGRFLEKREEAEES